jgi:hypothetical protein
VRLLLSQRQSRIRWCVGISRGGRLWVALARHSHVPADDVQHTFHAVVGCPCVRASVRAYVEETRITAVRSPCDARSMRLSLSFSCCIRAVRNCCMGATSTHETAAVKSSMGKFDGSGADQSSARTHAHSSSTLWNNKLDTIALLEFLGLRRAGCRRARKYTCVDRGRVSEGPQGTTVPLLERLGNVEEVRSNIDIYHSQSGRKRNGSKS